MVPGSTLRYGSNFIRLTVMPRLSNRHPMEAAASPLPSEDTTPPVTKMYFADIVSSPQLCLEICAGWCARSIMTEGDAEGNGQIRLRASGFRRLASDVRLRDLNRLRGNGGLVRL